MTKRQTNWNLCCLCQKEKRGEKLISPRLQDHDGYTMLATNIPLFSEIHEMPLIMDPTRLDEGSGIEATLRANQAKYHRNCRLLFNNTKLERARKRRLDRQMSETEASHVKQRRSSHDNQACIFCEKVAPASDLRQVMTKNLDRRLHECAETLSDGQLLAKLSGGDAIAQELKYHCLCLRVLYNRERSHLSKLQKGQHSTQDPDVCPLVLSELVTYIVESSLYSNGPVTFRLADICRLYKQRLEQLGMDTPDVNSTRLKDKLMAEIPELEAHRSGRDVLLALQQDVGKALAQSSDFSEAVIIAKAAKILRKCILDHPSRFDGTIPEGSVRNATPPLLLQFVGMVEHGSDIKSQLRFGALKSDQAIAQLLQFNCYSRYKEGAATHRHSKDRETPFPVYMGLSVYTKTRKRQLVEMLHEHGLSISYDRVLEISAQLGDATVNKYVEEGVVCPPVLRKGLFTTAVMDNIDHNPTATTATTSFHGTSISVFQHPSKKNGGQKRQQLLFGPASVKSVPELPDTFTNIPPAHFKTKNPLPPNISLPEQATHIFTPQLALEYHWLEKVIVTQEIDGEVNLTWSAHHASSKRSPEFEVSLTSLLPLLRDQAHSVATVKHVMDKVRDVVDFLNPHYQVPVITADQPIYALAKQVQWQWPERYGEDRYLVMFGGLHIEMAALKSLGTLLQGSGWTGALVEAGVASSGTAESFLSAASVTRTRQMHQVTACSLYKLLKAAYADHCAELQDRGEEASSFDNWCALRKEESPQFQFWHMVLTMELVVFVLIRSFREANFALYCQALGQLIPFFFANNNTNYARWLPVHLRDMLTLETTHPVVFEEFQKGNFVVHKTNRDFSAMALDQAHEQANAIIKADGGAIGLTEDPSALRRWMVAGPEVSRLVAMYEMEVQTSEASEHTIHHDQTPQAQKTFIERVSKLSLALLELGNPFQEESQDLYSIDTKDIACLSSVECLKSHFEQGQSKFQEFSKALKNNPGSFYEPIKKNKLDFFEQGSASVEPSKQKLLKEDCQLFSKLFISCQTRECDLEEFFQHENQAFPAALSECGKLYTCQKSQLTSIFETHIPSIDQEPDADVLIVDGSALVHFLPPKKGKTFESYATLDFLPSIYKYATMYQTTHLIFDVYNPSSLKNETRSKRGQSGRRKVTNCNTVPSNWRNFLRHNDNKTELFQLLAHTVSQMSAPNLVIVTKGPSVLSTDEACLQGLDKCSHEEADSRIFVHAKYAAENGSKAIMIKANDTDVVVIAVSLFPVLQDLGLEQLWVAFGQGQSLRWISVHDLCHNLGQEKVKGMLFFHAFTGCDTVSAFRTKGKKTAWQTWNICPEASTVFSKMSNYPLTVEDCDLEILEKYVILMYDKSSTAATVDEARLDMFARKQRPYEAIPPTKAALLQHTKRAAYQAGCVWAQATKCQPEAESPSNWGWQKFGEEWQVFWTANSSIAKSCQQLTKCGCKTDCHGRCKCYRLGLRCTGLCLCKCEI